MDLQQLRERVEREMVHAPNVRAHRDDINERLNDAQAYIGGLERWVWLDRLWSWRLLPPLTLTSDDYTADPAGGGPAKASTVQFDMPTTDGWEFQDGTLLAGHTITWGGNDYVIERSWGVSSGPLTLFYIVLDSRFDGTNPPSGDIVFNFDRYLMPPDMAEMYTVMSRSDDKGPIQELAAKTEEWLYLNRDEPPGEPVAFLASHNLPQPYRDDLIGVPLNDRVDAPRTAPTLTSAAGGSLNGGQEYEYFYVWVVAGMISPPSPIAKVTIGAGEGTVDISDLETAESAYTAAACGRERWIYRRTLEGEWRRIHMLLTDSTVTTYSDTGLQQIQQVDLYPRANRWLLADGQYRHYRVWPPPVTRKDLEVRYLARIPKMEAKSDTPFMPPEFRNVLVHYVCRDLSILADNERMATYHEKRLKEYLGMMRRRGLVSDAQRHIRRSMFNRPGQRPIPLVQPPVLLG